MFRAASAGAAAALAIGLLVPGPALAHPLGNFTINVYVGIRASATGLRLDTVVDRAEIPTFQERLTIDADGDGEVSDAEADAARGPECDAVVPSLHVVVGGEPAKPALVAAGLSFPPGAGGLSTMRLVCELDVPFDAPLTGPTTINVTNRIEVGRLGWREITLRGDGVTARSTGSKIAETSVSARLTNYPAALIQKPFDETEATFVVTPGGAALPPLMVDDATPLAGAAPSNAPSIAPPNVGSAAPSPAAMNVPGGVGTELPAVFQTANLSPAVVLLALATAVALGAAHAVTPGHGKTLVAAYLVGTHGGIRHAAWLGLSVTVAHTIGILALALVIVAAQSALPPDVVVRWLPAVAALTFAAIGAWMLLSEWRRRRHASGHRHEHDDHHDHSASARNTTVTRRGLVALGLAGGIVPSASALLILLATIATGRAAFGVVLVVAFGIGMAIVLVGVGVAMVQARARIGRLAANGAFGAARGIDRVVDVAPVVAGAVIFGFGVWLTAQAVFGRPGL